VHQLGRVRAVRSALVANIRPWRTLIISAY